MTCDETYFLWRVCDHRDFHAIGSICDVAEASSHYAASVYAAAIERYVIQNAVSRFMCDV